MKTTKTIKNLYLGMNMEIYLPLMDDVDYLVNELCEPLSLTRETIYKLILSLSYYGHYFENEKSYSDEDYYNYERQLVLKFSDLQTISKVNDIEIYILIKIFTVMAQDCLPSTEFVVITL